MLGHANVCVDVYSLAPKLTAARTMYDLRVSREIYHSASQATNGKARNKFTRLTFTDTRRSIRGASPTIYIRSRSDERDSGNVCSDEL